MTTKGSFTIINVCFCSNMWVDEQNILKIKIRFSTPEGFRTSSQQREVTQVEFNIVFLLFNKPVNLQSILTCINLASVRSVFSRSKLGLGGWVQNFETKIEILKH